jgi:branched-chain amino acid transport system ATP-binding protein
MGALRQAKVSALFVEHDMDVVERYADRVVVWEAGRVMAEGKPETVFKDARVIENVIGVA